MTDQHIFDPSNTIKDLKSQAIKRITDDLKIVIKCEGFDICKPLTRLECVSISPTEGAIAVEQSDKKADIRVVFYWITISDYEHILLNIMKTWEIPEIIAPCPVDAKYIADLLYTLTDSLMITYHGDNLVISTNASTGYLRKSTVYKIAADAIRTAVKDRAALLRVKEYRSSKRSVPEGPISEHPGGCTCRGCSECYR